MRTPINRDPSRIPPLAIPSAAAEPAVKAPVVKAPVVKTPRAKATAKAPSAAKPQRAAATKPVADAIELKPFISEAPVPTKPNFFLRLATSDYTPSTVLLAGALSFYSPTAGLVALSAGVANAFDVFGRVGRFVKRGADSLAHAVEKRNVEKPNVERKEPTVARNDEAAPKTIRRGTAEDARKEPVLAPASEPDVHLPSHGEVPFALELAIRQAALGEVTPRPRHT